MFYHTLILSAVLSSCPPPRSDAKHAASTSIPLHGPNTLRNVGDAIYATISAVPKSHCSTPITPSVAEISGGENILAEIADKPLKEDVIVTDTRKYVSPVKAVVSG